MEHEIYQEKVEVDLEGELFSSLEGIDRLGKKKKKEKDLLFKYEKERHKYEDQSFF